MFDFSSLNESPTAQPIPLSFAPFPRPKNNASALMLGIMHGSVIIIMYGFYLFFIFIFSP